MQPGPHLSSSGILHFLDLAEQIVRERHSGARRTRLEFAVQRLGYVSDLDHRAHV